MLQFTINEKRCVQCGLCAQDCPIGIIDMSDYPFIEQEGCIKCQHCQAICPTGALSILGNNPDDSTPLEGNLPDPKTMATLIRGRRSVRKYKNEEIPREIIQELVDTAWNAPTGKNWQSTLLTVIDDKKSMDALRQKHTNVWST